MSRGQRLNQYEVLGRIGAGGMGEVYRARDSRLGRDVALKVLHRRYADDPASRQRLGREAQLVAQLTHPNVGAIHGLEEADGVMFLVLELVEGETLAHRLEEGPLPVRDALDVAMQICGAVGEAHRRGILHRDLKPANVMIDGDGRVRVLDFGLATCRGDCPPVLATSSASPDDATAELPENVVRMARLRAAGAVALTASSESTLAAFDGTPAYMSPEQLQGEPVDQRADVWAMGCVLFEMLTGEQAFAADSLGTTFERIVNDEPAWHLLPEATPESARVLLRQMLDKRPVHRLSNLRDARVLIEGALAISAGRPRSPRRTAAWAAAAAVAVVLAVAGGVLGFTSMGGGRNPSFAAIAVLPIDNLTGDPERDAFADGLTEELTTELGRIEALKVVSRSSVRALVGTGAPLPRLADDLGVRTLVEASLSGADPLRLSVRLYDAAQDVQLWGDTFETTADGIERVQSRIAQEIAVRLGVELTAEERRLLGATRVVDPQASAAYLNGRYWANSGNGARAIEEFQRAVEIDPGYGPAWAALANQYIYRLPSPEFMPRARHAAQTAVNLDETLGEAHAALAQVRFFFDWDWRGAEAAFQRAVALTPSSAVVRHRYAALLWAMGRLDEARTQLDRAHELDPMSLFIKLELARTDYFARRYDDAANGYRELLLLEPDFFWAHLFLGLTHQQAGALEESATDLISAHELLRDELGAKLRAGYEVGGYDGLLRAWIAASENNPRVQPTSLAAQHTWLGNHDEAFRKLEEAFDERTRALVWIGVDPQFDAIRDDPRFANLLQRMGLRNSYLSDGGHANVSKSSTLPR
jgi:serine/threonine-protein kinase